VLNNLINKKRK